MTAQAYEPYFPGAYRPDPRVETRTVPGQRLGWRRLRPGIWGHAATGKLQAVQGNQLLFVVLAGLSEDELDEMAKTGG